MKIKQSVRIDGVSDDQSDSILDALRNVFNPHSEQTLKIAVIGEAGVGKTTTLNALFNTNMPVSHFAPCTQKDEVLQTMTPNGVNLEVFDLPGLSANKEESTRHWETYNRVLSKVDSAVWVISAGDRALEGMQTSLERIAAFSGDAFIDRMVFGVNKAEHMHPENWNTSVNCPSHEQECFLIKFCETVKAVIQKSFPKWDGVIRYYSALKRFRLDELLEQMLLSADCDGRILISRTANLADPTELIENKRALEIARQMIKNRRRE